MRALPIVAAIACAASGALPAYALPTAVPEPSPQLLLAAKHHGHHWRWRYYRNYGWYGYPRYYYATPPETQAQSAETPSALYPPSIGSGTSQPAAPAQTTPDPGASRAPATRPKIEWVNPDRPAR